MNEIDKLYDQIIVEYPNNFEQLKTQIKSLPTYDEYSKLLRNKIINGMLPCVVDSVRSAVAMCGNIRNVDNSLVKNAIIKYINSVDIFDTVILHIIDNSNPDGSWEICGLYDNNMACNIFKLM